MDARFRAALDRLNNGAAVPWSSSGSYVEDLQRQLNPAHHSTFERAMQFRAREKEAFSTLAQERDTLKRELRDARMAAARNKYAMQVQNSNMRLLANGRRPSANTSNARPSRPDPVPHEPTPERVRPGVQCAREQRTDDGPARDGGGHVDVQPELHTDAPDLAGHSGEHGAEEQPAEPDSGAGVQAAEGTVREGGE